MIGAAFGLGFIFGPAIGGILSHWGIHVPFFFAAALCFSNALLLFFTLPETVTADHPAKHSAAGGRSLGNIVAHGNVVDQAVLAILAIMSMGSWYILFTKLWDTSKIAREAKEVRASFFKKASLQEGLKSLSETGAFRFIAQTGVEASEHHEGALTENIDHNTWVTMNIDRAVQEVNSRLQGGLGFLATVGSTSPFIGLFGTVWGILQALTQIGVAGQASIDKVAGPVGAALIMTAIGLGVAVPAVLGYNWLVNRNKSVMGQVRAFAADLHGVLTARMRAGFRNGSRTPL